VIGHRQQHGVDVRPGEQCAEIGVRLHAVVTGLAEFFGVDLVAALPGAFAAFAADVANRHHLHVRTRDVPARHVRPRAPSRWPEPWPPRPTNPIWMRSLGARSPARPNAEAGMRVGARAAAATSWPFDAESHDGW